MHKFNGTFYFDSPAEDPLEMELEADDFTTLINLIISEINDDTQLDPVDKGRLLTAHHIPDAFKPAFRLVDPKDFEETARRAAIVWMQRIYNAHINPEKAKAFFIYTFTE